MEGANHQSGKNKQHRVVVGGVGALGPPLPRPPNQKPLSHPNLNISIPPPLSQLCPQRLLRSPGSLPQSRSLSQPPLAMLDSLPPLNLNPPRFNSSIPISTDDVKLKSEMENNPSVPLNRRVHNTFQAGVSVALPPSKGHRRSISDSPLGSYGYIQSSPSFGGGESSAWKPAQLALKAETNADDARLSSQYMSWESIDKVNFFGDKDYLDSWINGTKSLERSDSEVESRVDGKASGAYGASSSFSKERREGSSKRSLNGDIALISQHRRGFSLDSSIGSFHAQDGLPKVSPVNSLVGQFSPMSSMDSKISFISQELGKKGEFCEEEIKKIMKSDKLVEVALTDPKRVKRILSNRQSAARSKEKKVQYIAELEQKVQTLQSEKATLSTLVTKLQRDNSELKSESKEYKLRLQAKEGQSQLNETLSETLDMEVQKLGSIAANLGGGESLANAIGQQLALNQPRFQFQQQQQQQRHFVMQNLPAKDERESPSEEIQGNALHPKP